MEDNELRVGNYAGNRVYKNSPVICVTAEVIYNSADLLEPIPLTERWLLDFGFEIRSENPIFPYYEKKIIKVAVEYKFKISEIDPGLYMFLEGNLNVHIEYVHELQNIWYFITKKDLNKKVC